MQLTRLPELALGLVALEGMILAARGPGRHPPSPGATTAGLLCNLGAGAALILGIRQQRDGHRPAWLIACLGVALACHAGDLRSRLSP